MRKSLGFWNLRTGSAQRFEKGLDPALIEPAMWRFLFLLRESCPQLRYAPFAARTYSPPRRNRLECSLGFLQNKLGFSIQASEIEDILGRLGFEIRTYTDKSDQVERARDAASFDSL